MLAGAVKSAADLRGGPSKAARQDRTPNKGWSADSVFKSPREKRAGT